MTSRVNWHNMKRPKTWPVSQSAVRTKPLTPFNQHFYHLILSIVPRRTAYFTDSDGIRFGNSVPLDASRARQLLFNYSILLVSCCTKQTSECSRPLVLTPVGYLFQQEMDVISISYSVCKEVECTNDFFSWHCCLSVDVTPGLIYVVCSPSFCIVFWIAKVSKMLRKRFCYWCC